jgi:hypothetical protein
MVVVHESRDRLANARAIRSVAPAARKRRDQCALHLLLEVEDREVSLVTQLAAKRRPFAPRRARREVMPPASKTDRDRAAYTSFHRDQRRVSLLGDPVDRELRAVGSDVGDDRQRVDDIAQRRWADHQDGAHSDGPLAPAVPGGAAAALIGQTT